MALGGVLTAAAAGELPASATVVCTVSGSGFKDEASLASMIGDTGCPCLDYVDEIVSLVLG